MANNVVPLDTKRPAPVASSPLVDRRNHPRIRVHPAQSPSRPSNAEPGGP
jgi:hypothetical protein